MNKSDMDALKSSIATLTLVFEARYKVSVVSTKYAICRVWKECNDWL